MTVCSEERKVVSINEGHAKRFVDKFVKEIGYNRIRYQRLPELDTDGMFGYRIHDNSICIDISFPGLSTYGEERQLFKFDDDKVDVNTDNIYLHMNHTRQRWHDALKTTKVTFELLSKNVY